jgi:hypothetical protein
MGTDDERVGLAVRRVVRRIRAELVIRDIPVIRVTLTLAARE